MTRPADLHPAMGVGPEPRWPGARWIGTIESAEVDRLPDEVDLVGATGFSHARFLVRDGLAVLGFVEVPVRHARIAAAELRAEVAGLAPSAGVSDAPLPPITVATTTRNRPHNVEPLVRSLLSLDYPDFEILIVDNASDTMATKHAVDAIGDARVRCVREPMPGAARGRNTAVLAAKHDIVAFVDDDVIVDPRWLRGVAHGFTRADDVGLVTGMVPSGELLTEAQGYFESRIGWEVACRPRVFSLDDPPPDIPLFPFEVGAYGTGANYAIRRDVAVALGGMNEALGTGSPAGGGEDIDLFVRVLYAGHSLVYEPTSVVWHRHRRDSDALATQMRSYGRGFGAWITTVLLDPQMRPDALRLMVGGLKRARTAAVTEGFDEPERRALPDGVSGSELRRSELLGVASGPYWYARSRLDRRLRRPLSTR